MGRDRSGTDSAGLFPGVKAVVVVAVHVLRPTEPCLRRRRRRRRHRPGMESANASGEYCDVFSIENSNSESNRTGIGPGEGAGGQAVVHTSVLVSSSTKKERYAFVEGPIGAQKFRSRNSRLIRKF